MALFLFNNKFVEFPKHQVNPGEIGTKYIEIEEASEEMDRYNYAKSLGLMPKKEWVFDNNWAIYDEYTLTLRKEALTDELSTKYQKVVENGCNFSGSVFLLDERTKTNISDWNQFFTKEKEIINEDPNYERMITTASISDKNSIQRYIPLDSWNSFFMQFSTLYAYKYSIYKNKSNYIQTATSSLQLVNFNTDI